ncbi:MAG: MFS transporter [Thermoguttaceae bacterium]|nr:MFS transporter [Thermoguttaceae bacterium]
MSESKGGGAMYLRLQIAYALEFAVWGCWSYKLGGYCAAHHINGGLLYSAFALGALFAPVIGPIADKKFAAQKVFAFMQLICGLALFACHKVAHDVAMNVPLGIGANETVAPGFLWLALMFIAGLMFMPSIPLLNAIVFKHIPNKDRSPWIFIFGTLGWIAVNLLLKYMPLNSGMENLYLVDGAVAILLAIYALTLPDTPPSGNTSSDPFGFKALALFKNPSFAIFIVCATIVGIFGSNFYFAMMDQCFPEKGTLNQFSEIFFMAALGIAVGKIGLKWVLTIGMAAWGVRYLLFSTGNDAMAVIGILCHGGAYAFLYTAAYMYGDKIAPKEMKASVQALIAFLLLGVAQVLSGFAADGLRNEYKNSDSETESVAVERVNLSLISSVYGQEDPIPLDAVQENVETVADSAQAAVADVAETAQETASEVAENVQEAVAEGVEAVQEVAAENVDTEQEENSDAVTDKEEAQEAEVDGTGTVQEPGDEEVDAADQDNDETGAVVDQSTSEQSQLCERQFLGITIYYWSKVQEAEQSEYSLWDFKKVWNTEVKGNFQWGKIWGIPCVVCLMGALIFLLRGKEPVSPDEETKEE